MPRDDVATVVRMLGRWSDGDDATALEDVAPDVEYHHNIGLGTPLEGVYEGHDGMHRLWAAVHEAFEEARFEFQEAFEDRGRVVVLGRLHVRGKDSGARADTPFGAVAELGDGVIVRLWLWTDQSKALEAVGLPETRPGPGR